MLVAVRKKGITIHIHTLLHQEQYVNTVIEKLNAHYCPEKLQSVTTRQTGTNPCQEWKNCEQDISNGEGKTQPTSRLTISISATFTRRCIITSARLAQAAPDTRGLSNSKSH